MWHCHSPWLGALLDLVLVPCGRASGAPQQLNADSASASTALRPCPGSVWAGPTHPNTVWSPRASPCPGAGSRRALQPGTAAGSRERGPSHLLGCHTSGGCCAFYQRPSLFPRSPVFPLQPAHCAAGWSSWVECFRLKYNFSAFKSLRSSLPLPPPPPRRPATPTRDNLMDYSVGLRGSP